ncbi:hypothetical protein L3Q82_011236 [Scortum barcoo]|uniref:Uncharacterized protein n=1 Tax=Scortum barcoo TaxID=214431 RepID=A0ACB8WCG2_9TELE|nr:hypothetical protein L3Q82_011236 [Scortum barcoo]
MMNMYIFSFPLKGSNDFLLEGDILIPKTRNAMKCLNATYSCLWPKSANGKVEIPFLISSNYDDTERAAILQAMKDFEQDTCIRFIPRATQTAYLTIEPKSGCFSLLGRIGNSQLVSLQRFACIEHGIIQHELLHALGFYHEHTRSDRDQYIRINWENINQYFVNNFDKQDTNNLNTPYDYSSVMHYGRTAFGKNGLETIIPIPDSSVPIGQTKGMSNIDISEKDRRKGEQVGHLCRAGRPTVGGEGARHPGVDDDFADDKSDMTDFTATILKTNKGSNDFLLEGDILIPKTRNAMKCLNATYSCLWPKSANGKVEIPFLISSNYDDTERAAILQAMKDFEQDTCIRFIPRATQTAYLTIEPKSGCFSLLGRIGDRQVVSLQRFSCIDHGIIQHELLHALGFYHEHTRSDRDQYIRINWENIDKSVLYNFDKQDTNNLNTPYDYSSVMHYGRTAFGKNGLETIIPIPDSSVPIGQRKGMSNIDIVRINRLYKC